MNIIILLIILMITLIVGIIIIIIHYLMDDREACQICPHVGLEICHNCTHEDRERIIKLYKDGGVIL